MDSYSLHFFGALFLADVLLLLSGLWLKVPHFRYGFVIIPVITFLLFYNYDLGLIQSSFVYVVGYVGALWVLYIFLLIMSFRRESFSVCVRYCTVKILLCWIAQLGLIALFLLIPWAIDTFPLSNSDAVLFTLYAPIEGSNDFLVRTLIGLVIKPSLVVFALTLTIQVVLSIVLFRSHLSGTLQRGPVCFSFGSSLKKRLLALQVSKFVCFFLLGSTFTYFLILPYIVKSDAFEALFGESVDSSFYKEHFMAPELFSCGHSKNLIVIFLESMSNNFSFFTPELNLWKRNGVFFLPGGVSVSGTSWTIAGVTASLCGVPLNMPVTDREYLGDLPTYLPNAVCITDFFKQYGYNQIAIQGSSADFTQFRRFWGNHGGVEIRDNLYYKEKGRIPSDYHVFWGMEDRKTLEFSKEAIDSLSRLNRPFALYISTIDTHQPDGFLDSSCQFDENTQYKKVLRCSSAMIGDFLTWMKNQSWYENTVVAVVGDHIIQNLASKAGLPLHEKLYTTAFFLNAGIKSVEKNRSFTNLDYAPTILEAMECNLPKHGYGLGRSLFSKEKTMLEIYGEDSLNALLRQRSVQYDYFLFGK